MLGAPGAGKGTQAQILEKRFDVWQISTGDLLRMHRHEGTPLGLQASEYMDRGELVPDSLIIAMVETALGGVEDFILDGFPRTVAQAQALDALLDRLGLPLDAVILFEATPEALFSRLTARWVNPRSGRSYNSITRPPLVAGVDDEDGGPLEQRIDDQPDTVRNRLAVYERQTTPLIEYYRETGKIVAIDALADVVSMTESIVDGIRSKVGSVL